MGKNKENETWDDLEVFTQKGAKIGDSKITITDHSTVVFNAGFCHRAAVEKNSHVIMAYSPKNRAIVFQFTSDSKADGALKIIQRTGSASVGSRSFFNYYFLRSKDLAGRYEPVKEKLPKIGDAWLIYLDKKMKEDE